MAMSVNLFDLNCSVIITITTVERQKPRTHNVVRNLENPIDDIWMDFKQKVRKNVKRANSYGLEILIDETGAYIEDFLRIYYGTMERSDAEKQFYI